MAKPPPTSVQKLLKSLHDTPVDNAGASDQVLGTVYAYLMDVPPSSVDQKLHWFCENANSTTIAAASFLLRLFAYDSPQVEKWKSRLSTSLRGCCDCVRSLEKIKVESRHTYFAAFPNDTMQSFYKSFEAWELATVRVDISNIRANGLETRGVQPGALYRILFNSTVFADQGIQTALQDGLYRIDSWPKEIVPPGVLLLLFHKDPAIRQWSQTIASKATIIPIPKEQFVGMYRDILTSIVDLLSFDMLSNSQSRFPTFAFTTDKRDVWQALQIFLRHVHPELLKDKEKSIDIRHVVVGHLHDSGAEFSEVLGCLLLLLKRLGAEFWSDENDEYPQVVFDAVKDNPAFATLLETADPGAERSRYLAWFAEYLHTIRKSRVFAEVLAKIIDFLCEEMQHERFGVSRPSTMNTAMLLLSGVLRKREDENAPMVDAALRVIDIHTDIIVSVALSRAYNDEQWKGARASARSLVSNTLTRDIERVSSVMTMLCATLAEVTNKRPVQTKIHEFSVRTQMWNKIYQIMQTNDVAGLVTVISIVARAAHIDKLSTKPYAPTFNIIDVAEGYMTPKAAFDAINNAIDTFSDGFLSAMTRFGDYNVSTSGINVLQQRGAAKDAMLLLLSPVPEIQAAAKSLISLAYDVDGRQDCFRALLENLPDGSFEGITDFLTAFVQFAPLVPEACSLSGSLVRCFTDIIEALCASAAGLLRDTSFLRPSDEHGPAAQLPQLWTLMTKSLSVIFKRCPSWSIFFENEEMILWMRDALIFGRDMLAQWRVIAKAASSRLPGSVKPTKLSPVGKKMVNSLQEVLPELARWLRLTDEELLHQSFALIQSLLDVFRDTGIPPSSEGLAKLAKHLESAKKDKTKTTTRLDSSRLSALANALASFEETDDIEIVGTSIASKKDVKVEQPRPERKSSLTKTHEAKPQQARVPQRLSSYFTEDDQRRLDAASSMPTWKKSEAAPAGVGISSNLKALKIKDDSRPSSRPVSSSESDDSDSDEGEHRGGLAALAKFQKSPKIKKMADRRQIKTIEITGVKDALQERRERRDRQEEARRVALRMKPNISGLHRALLSWDYGHNGPMPPGEKVDVSHVPDTFKDYNDYHRVFGPLLLIECWAQICQAKDEQQEQYNVKISGRGFVDDWLDIEVAFIGDLKREWYLAETDVVLLRNPSNQRCIMAKTQSYRSSFQGAQATLRSIVRSDGDPGPQIATVWSLSKIFSLSTIHREYAALVSLPYYDYVDMILRPHLPMPPQVDRKDVENAMSKYGINEPQANAILSSLGMSGFSLIQGPPGTGKTSTICGLVAVFLSKRGRPATAVHVGKSSTPADKGATAKILICAPSNAAIDEIAYRIKEGYRGSRLRPDNAKVVRIGTEKAMNLSVRDVSLDALVDQKLNGSTSATKEKDLASEVSSLRKNLESVKDMRKKKLAVLTNLQDNVVRYKALEDELKKLNSQRITLTQQLDQLKDQQKSESRTLDAIRRRTRLEVLQEADVICSTLSGAGHEILDQFEFETIVIDEAAQAIELSSLIPLKYKCNRCVLVGDPQQLPPTVISQEATRYLYNQSLFVRLQKQRPEAMQLLNIQYRMHPDISRLPSRVFYQGRLQDGPDMATKTTQPWHSHSKFGTYKFFNIIGTEEQSGRSLVNKAECQVAASLYARLRREFSSVNLDFRVGVVSMYRSQVVELRRQFERYLGEKLEGKVDFNTVDGFQGQEKDIIILSCVRGGLGQDTVGFLADIRRMNVALTRAKSSLFILGNAPTLERSNATWAEIIADARSRSCLISADSGYFAAPVPASPTIRHIPISPRKMTRPAPTPIPVPTDIYTPQSLKARVDQSQGSPKQGGFDQSAGPSGRKRPAEDAVGAAPPRKASRTDEAQASTAQSTSRPPPPKRPKQPQTMFIPKKKRL